MKSKNEFDRNWKTEWKAWWKPLLISKGKFSERKIKNEIHDLAFVAEQVSEVYCEITGNKLSKPFYYAKTILDQYHEELEDSYQSGFEEAREIFEKK